MISKISTQLLEINSIQISLEVNRVPAASEANKAGLNKLDVCVTVHHWYCDVSNQQDAVKFVLLLLLSSLYMFQATVSPIFRSTLSVNTASWNNVLTY